MYLCIQVLDRLEGSQTKPLILLFYLKESLKYIIHHSIFIIHALYIIHSTKNLFKSRVCWNQIIISLCYEGYQENLYTEPHEEEYVRVGYQGKKEIEGGHGFHIPSSGFLSKQSFDGADPGRRGLKSLGYDIPGPNSLNLERFEPARNSYNPDGFQYKSKKGSKTPVYGSPNLTGYSVAALSPGRGFYEKLVEQNVAQGLDGPEDGDGVEAAAEAAVEQEIENDPR